MQVSFSVKNSVNADVPASSTDKCRFSAPGATRPGRRSTHRLASRPRELNSPRLAHCRPYVRLMCPSGWRTPIANQGSRCVGISVLHRRSLLVSRSCRSRPSQNRSSTGWSLGRRPGPPPSWCWSRGRLADMPRWQRVGLGLAIPLASWSDACVFQRSCCLRGVHRAA